MKKTHSELIGENESLLWDIAILKEEIENLKEKLAGYKTLIEHHRDTHHGDQPNANHTP